MLLRNALLLALSFFVFRTHAQQVRPAASDRIYQQIASLNSLTKVLYIAAHPDDENTRLLAWLVNVKHVPTAYLSLTRGDGGQNIIGDEQGAPLGLIRTHELMEARNLDGAQQFFTRAVDFGFSKNSEETFTHWDRQRVIEDVVYVIQQYKPDVIICRFPPNAQAGHGHHAASAIVAAEAFKICGDQSKYGAAAWQPKRILFNAYRFGSSSTIKEGQFHLQVGDYVPVLGMGTGELAGKSRSIHRSQGAGTPSVAGAQSEYFELVDGAAFSKSIFEGVDTTWARAGAPALQKEVQAILSAYDFMHPEKSVQALINLRKKVAALNDTYWKTEKLKDIDAILLSAIGFMAEVACDVPEAVAGGMLPVKLNVLARSVQFPVAIQSIRTKGLSMDSGDASGVRLGFDSLHTLDFKVSIAKDKAITEPYWLAAKPESAAFYSINEAYKGLPETPNELGYILDVKIGKELVLPVFVPQSFKKLDPLKGDLVEPLRIVPDVTLQFTNKQFISNAKGIAELGIRLHANKALKDAVLQLVDEKGAVLLETKPMQLAKSHDTLISLGIADSKLSTGSTNIRAVLTADARQNTKTQHLIQYPHLPTLQYFSEAQALVLKREWQCLAKKIGFIEGAGDYMPTFLKACGLDVVILNDIYFDNPASLKQFDIIVAGVRAVNVEKKMRYWLPVLLNYVKEGGNLLLQYNTLQDLATTQIGPYPFTLSRGTRVTEEDAAVTFLKPDHILLQSPNKITQSDFENWVQERGVNFPTEWDSRYQTLFSMHDRGEKDLEGAFLYAPYGKGNYMYTSLSLFRQLPAGNVGAIRLLMNMLSVGKTTTK